MTEDEVAVLHANDAFYAAFSAGDMVGMAAIWAAGSPVTCCHPGWGVLAGREPVLASWRAILANPGSPRIRCFRPRAWLFGDAAYVVCLEGTEAGPPVLVATNVFAREDGAWRLVHHHAGQLAAEPDDEQGPVN
jgi:ketosteroid isomerase-like protein